MKWPTCKDLFRISDELTAIRTEQGYAKAATWVRKTRPDGIHHQGLHYLQIYTVLPTYLYAPNIVRVVHKKYGPKNITCLRKVRRGSRIYWMESVHHEGHCPGCIKPVLKRRERRLRRRHGRGGTTLLRRRDTFHFEKHEMCANIVNK